MAGRYPRHCDPSGDSPSLTTWSAFGSRAFPGSALSRAAWPAATLVTGWNRRPTAKVLKVTVSCSSAGPAGETAAGLRAAAAVLEALLQDAVEPLFTTHSVLPSLAEEDHLRFFFLTGDAVSLETGMCLRLLRGDRFPEGMAGSLADLHAGAAAAWVTMSFAGALAWRAGLSSSQLTGLKGADAGAWLVLGAAGAEDAKRSVVWDLPLDVAAFARQLSACKRRAVFILVVHSITPGRRSLRHVHKHMDTPETQFSPGAQSILPGSNYIRKDRGA